jgi:hypothetical protein
MSALLDFPVLTMAKRKNLGSRLQLRVETKWLEEVDRMAQTLGLSVAAYFRLAVSEDMQRRKEEKKRTPRSQS